MREREPTKEDLSPFWRAVFAPIWTFSLLERINKRAKKNRLAADWSANALAIAYLVLTIAWRLPDPYWLISLVAFLPLLPVQRTINALNSEMAPAAERNTRFSGANVVLVVVGGLFLVLTILGTLLPAA